jgi:ABC-type nitrate/sulfonate/bicarbonate transport system permease component
MNLPQIISIIIPLSLSDISLWLAVTAIILLITSELIISSPGISARILIEKKRLRLAAVGCGLAFLVTVVMRIFQPF